MTGYGKAEINLENVNFTIEVKSLNSKQIDTNIKMPSVFREKEIELRKLISEKLKRGKIELEVVPQGTLAERIRAGGAGIGGFYTQTSAETILANGKEKRKINGLNYVFEHPLKADVSLIKADQSDDWGNLTYNKAARNFAPVMCMAAKMTIVQVKTITLLGRIDPEHIITPSIFVNRIVQITNPINEAIAISNKSKK